MVAPAPGDPEQVRWMGRCRPRLRIDAPGSVTKAVQLTKAGHTGLPFSPQSLVGSLTAKTAVWAVAIVEVFPFAKALVEHPGVIDPRAVQHR